MEIENLDENAAWHKVFTSGSEALKSKLKKVHAKNPKFQAFLKSGGYEGEQKSAAQAKKDVAVINKAKAKAAEPKKVDRIELIRRAVEKRNARNKEFKLRRAFGGEPLGAEHDNPISMARAGMPIKGYRLGEEMDAKEKRIANLKRQLIKGVASKGKSRETATAYASAQEVLGGPVVAKSTLPAGKRPAGQRRARSLARAALKNLLVKRKGK